MQNDHEQLVETREQLRMSGRKVDQLRKLVRCENAELIDSLVFAATEEGCENIANDLGCDPNDVRELVASGLLDIIGITLEIREGA